MGNSVEQAPQTHIAQVASVIPVLREHADDPQFEVNHLPRLREYALMSMAGTGSIDESTLEWEVLRPAEIDGIRMPLTLPDGTEISNNMAVVRFSAKGVPHGR